MIFLLLSQPFMTMLEHGVAISGGRQGELVFATDPQMRASIALSQVCSALRSLVPPDEGFERQRLDRTGQSSDLEAHSTIWPKILDTVGILTDAEAKSELLRDLADSIDFSSPRLRPHLIAFLKEVDAIDADAVRVMLERKGEDPSLGQTDSDVRLYSRRPLEHLRGALNKANVHGLATGTERVVDSFLGEVNDKLAAITPYAGRNR